MKSNLILTVLSLTTLTILFVLYQNRKSDLELEYLGPHQLPVNHLLESLPWNLINIPFKYILNNADLCGNQNEEIVAVFIVTSYFGNIETRSSMRRSFSNEDLKRLKLRRVFLLGEAKEDRYISQKSISSENDRFHDIIQGNFSEAYRNLTYKHIMGLKWASTFCSNAKYVIKMDDDIVVNMHNLNLIVQPLEKLKRKFIAGYVLRNLKAIREPYNKWYVTQEEYSFNSYPSFVSGWFYVTTPQSAKQIGILSSYEKYFWIDDVFVTGILAQKLNIILFDISKHFTVNSEFLQCCLQDFEKNIDCDINIGPNGGDSNMFYQFNNNFKKCASTKCHQRTKLLNETCVAERKINLGMGDAVISDFRLT